MTISGLRIRWKIGKAWRYYLLTLATLLVVYALTLLRQVAGGFINGTLTPYMDDVGEIQVALNVWGTIHHTGYPLFAVLGNLAVGAARAFGFDPATAPALFSLACGLLGLTVFYYLIYRLRHSAELAAGAMLLLGLARTIWAHHVIAEVYSLSLTFSIVLLAVALLPLGGITLRARVFMLALVGGFGVAHHRLITLLAPGLLLAVYWCARGSLHHPIGEPAITRQSLRWWIATFAIAVPIGLIGFIPYVYLPLRAQAGAAWVYGDPSTPSGLWHEFIGAEAAFLMQVPSAQGMINDAADTLRIIGEELTPGIALVALLLTVGALLKGGALARRQVAVAFGCVVGPLTFLVIQHRVVMPEATAMPVIMALVFGAAMGVPVANADRPIVRRLLLLACGLAAAIQIIAHWGFVRALTTDSTGVQMIALASRVPRDGSRAVLMLPWGPSYTAVAYSKYVTGENADLTLATHKTDLAALVARGDQLYTARDVFYRFPLEWWDSQLGRAYLSSPAEGVVMLRSTPLTAPPTESSIPVKYGVMMRNTSMCIEGDTIRLTVTWGATNTPAASLSTLVHLVGEGSRVPLATADTSAPVYGWYPTTRWLPGEVVYDSYVLPLLNGATHIVVGMYEQQADGAFSNYGETGLPLTFAQPCPR
jgi:hypothetical protein